MQKPSLVVLAAGIGSRFGGLKQIEPVGPAGETIIDYSVYDAIRSGFGKIVFVIRKSIEEDFRAIILRRFENRVETACAFQELNQAPDGFQIPSERNKPWGTGHAVLAAAEQISEPFAVINGDDFYGPRSMRILGEYLRNLKKNPDDTQDFAMVGFTLRHTLSDFGHVARGICGLDAERRLERVVEATRILRDGQGAKYTDDAGIEHLLSGDEIVSMNIWGFTPAIFSHLRKQFEDFLRTRGKDPKAEFYLPSAVNALIEQGAARVHVLPTPDAWCGVTYREDKPFVDHSIRRLIEEGAYPKNLWEKH